jgi:hypothetical protein
MSVFDPRSRGAINEKNMSAFNPPVQKHTFAERRDRGKACLHRLRRFAAECGMNAEGPMLAVVITGLSRSKNGVASARLCPVIHVFVVVQRRGWPGQARP